MTMEKRIRSLTALILAGMVLALAAGFMAGKKQTFSENENRYLAGFPHFTWERAVSGAYMEDWSSYLADQFPFRDFFVGAKTGMEYALGKREINQVFFAGDGYLIEEYAAPVNTDRIAAALHNFAEELESLQLEPRLMLVPTAYHVYREKLPAHVSWRDQMETAQTLYDASGMGPIDCSRALLTCGEEGLYYKTDHHWTTQGAYQGYRVFCEEMGLEPVDRKELTVQTAAEDFKGTLYSKSGDYTRPGEAITIYTNPADRLTVEYRDTGEKTDSLYNLDYAQQKDKYSLFLDNLHPLVEITNDTAQTDRELVLIKDSYANSIVPFLVRHFKKIYVFDTRYYKEGPSAFIKEHPGVTDVVLLYNMNTLDTDTGIRGVY